MLNKTEARTVAQLLIADGVTYDVSNGVAIESRIENYFIKWVYHNGPVKNVKVRFGDVYLGHGKYGPDEYEIPVKA
jgi:hypothetical protein